MDCPDASAILIKMLVPVLLAAFCPPKVIVYPTLAIAVFNGITSAPVNAHPFEPLPPVPLAAPGTPAPAYCVYASSHPLMVLVGPGNPGVGDENPPESIVVPGAAIQTPATPVVVVSLMSKLARLGLANAKVKYCVVVRFPPIA